MSKGAKKSTTPTPTGEGTVAEEVASGEVSEPSSEVVETANDAPPAPEEAKVVNLAGSAPTVGDATPALGDCVNKCGRPAVLRVDFKWQQPQEFCGVCLPRHLRYLL